MATKKAKPAALKPAPAAAPASPPPAAEPQGGPDVLAQAAADAPPDQAPELPPPPPDSGLPVPDQAQSPEPLWVGVDLACAAEGPRHLRVPAPIFDLADARALPDVSDGCVYVQASFEPAAAIRAFKDHDGRSMAVVWTGTTLAKAAITP